MGAKASTAANSGNQSPSRARTFSNSSSSNFMSGAVASNNVNVNGGATSTSGFNFLRAIHGVEVANDRQRARSLSSVPDLHHHHNTHHHLPPSNHNNSIHHPYSNISNNNLNLNDVNSMHMTIPTNSNSVVSVVGGVGVGSTSPETDSSNNDNDNNASAAVVMSAALGRVFTATSLPSHIWSLNGE